MFAFELIHGHEEHLVMIQRQTVTALSASPDSLKLLPESSWLTRLVTMKYDV